MLGEEGLTDHGPELSPIIRQPFPIPSQLILGRLGRAKHRLGECEGDPLDDFHHLDNGKTSHQFHKGFIGGQLLEQSNRPMGNGMLGEVESGRVQPDRID